MIPSMSSSYSCDLTLGCFRPMYHGSSRISARSHPTSICTGRQCLGDSPAHAVYRASLPIGIPIPFTPRSPRPRIRSPSVTTIAFTSVSWWFERTSRIRPLSFKLFRLVGTIGTRWWYDMMIRDDDTGWSYEMIIRDDDMWDDDMRWWYEMKIWDDDTGWYRCFSPDVYPSGCMSINMRPFLTSFTDSWCINKRHDFLRVLYESSWEEREEKEGRGRECRVGRDMSKRSAVIC